MEIVRRSGLGGIDGRELAEFVGSRGISFDTIVAPGREGLIAGGPRKEWPLLIRLVRTQLLKPQCSPAALEEYLADTEADAMGQDPSYAALAAFEAGIERALVGEKFSEPSRPALKLQKLCGQFHAMFGDTANMVIVVHGDLDPFDALSAVSSGLDIEPRQQASSRFQARPLANIKAGRETLRLGDGVSANVRLVIQQPLGGNPQAGQIAGEILSDRILHRLREVEQGTYSATAGVSVLDTPDRALLYISFDCDPLNVDRMITATRDELSKLANLGFKAEEFEAARDRVKGRPKSTKDIAETWLGRGTLTSSDDADSGDVRDWIGSNIDLRKLREFVRNPS
jgi:zinc protease